MHDPISDLLTRVRNAGMALHSDVVMPHSKLKESVAKLLQQEGYVSEVSVSGQKIKQLKLSLRYQSKRHVITGLRQISTPGLRRYVSAGEIPRVLGGMGVAVISTPKGVLTGSDARKLNVGGEVICYVW
jgi:small subunit ribosomal protein S8